MKRKYSGFIVATVIISVASQVNAQWLTQQIDLTTGWNAVHLYVQPANDSCSEIFADKPVSVVSWWCRDVSLLGVMPPAPDMRNWYAVDPAASTFYRMLGGECYLIQATAPTTITVKGTPALPTSSLWLGKPNLVGMSVPLPDNVQLNEYFGFLPV